MSEQQIPREVWGLWTLSGWVTSLGHLMTFASTEEIDEWAEAALVNSDTKVLLGGSALLDEVAKLREENTKLREVAKQASIVVDETMPDEPSDAMLSNHPHWHLFAALANAGYPKSSTTEATEDKT